MIKVKEGFEEIHDKLVEMDNALKAKYEAKYNEEADHIHKMIGECEEEVDDPVEEPVEEQPTVEENIVNE